MIVGFEDAVDCLRRDEVVAYPTETVYGLGADARSPAALARLRELKGREASRGLSVLVADLDELERNAPDLPDAARRLAARFWPGPLTLVIPLGNESLSGVATEQGVGFRCSPEPTAAALVRAFCGPVVSTSCNASGQPACLSAAQVQAWLGEDFPVVGGEDSGGRAPSTVVSIDVDGVSTLLREGAIPYENVLRELLVHE